MTAIALIAIALFCGWLFDCLVLRKRRSALAILAGPPSDNPIIGNIQAINGPESTEYLNGLTKQYGGVVRLHGLVGVQPWQLFVSDPEALHSVFVANTEVWKKAAIGNTFNKLLFGQGVLTVSGEDHRRQRKSLTPIFSTQQMRAFLPGFYEVSRTLCKRLRTEIEKSDQEVTLDMLRLLSQTALDLVGTSAIGYNFNTLNTDSEYSDAVKRVFPTLSELGPATLLVSPLSKLGPWHFRRRLMDLTFPYLGSLGDVGIRFRNILEVIESTSLQIYGEKKEEMANGLYRDDGAKDVIASLIRESKTNTKNALNEHEIVSQIQTMVFAGHETTSTALTRSLQVLSQNTKLQESLRSECVQTNIAHSGGDLDYDTIQALPFLDAFVREVLRLHPPVAVMAREAAEDTVLPLHTPIKATDGTMIKEISIPKGSFALLGISAMNLSEAVFGEDAKEFKPERWLGDGPTPGSHLKNPGAYSSMLTFSGGNRSCLGFKFAVLEIKVVLYLLMNSFSISPAYSDDDIIWKTAITMFPSIRGQVDRGPQLPMKIAAL